jgi:MULE transposase domain
MAVCDGTFTGGNAFKHIILISTTFDPNNQLVMLAVGIVDCENTDNWVWFKEHLEANILGISVWMSDANKGIRTAVFSQSMSMSQPMDQFVLSRCTRHLAENCRENCKGTMNEDDKCLIIDLAKSLNVEV